MKLRILVLGAGFGGLELSTMLSEALGDQLDLTLIDKSDTFFIGFSKFDVMFGRKTAQEVRLPYREMIKPGVQFRQETITAINPESRRVTTGRGTYEADVLVVALGADYDLEFTPGLIEGGHEFYSFSGAERLREHLPTFNQGQVVVGVARCGRIAPVTQPPHRRCKEGRVSARRLEDVPVLRPDLLDLVPKLRQDVVNQHQRRAVDPEFLADVVTPRGLLTFAAARGLVNQRVLVDVRYRLA